MFFLSMFRFDSEQSGQGQGTGDTRAHGRRHQQDLFCTFGRVLDLSRGGMRVQTSRAMEGERTVELFTDQGKLSVDVRSVWSQRNGLRRFEIGFRFLNVDAALANELTRISSSFAMLDRSVA